MRSERSVLDVVNDIVGNVQDIVRSELRLARAEVGDELTALKSSAVGIGIAVLAGIFATLFGLISAMFALTNVLTPWGAALVIAGVLAVMCIASWASTSMRSRRASESTKRPSGVREII